MTDDERIDALVKLCKRLIDAYESSERELTEYDGFGLGRNDADIDIEVAALNLELEALSLE